MVDDAQKLLKELLLLLLHASYDTIKMILSNLFNAMA